MEAPAYFFMKLKSWFKKKYVPLLVVGNSKVLLGGTPLDWWRVFFDKIVNVEELWTASVVSICDSNRSKPSSSSPKASSTFSGSESLNVSVFWLESTWLYAIWFMRIFLKNWPEGRKRLKCRENMAPRKYNTSEIHNYIIN